MSETIGISQASIGNVRNWHSPHNEDCMHNASPAADCTCKRVVERKPYRTLRVTDPEAKKARDIVAEVRLSNGLLTLRRKGYRRRFSVNLGVLYERLELNAALAAAREAKAKRKTRRRGK